jgi:hypothetical protein
MRAVQDQIREEETQTPLRGRRNSSGSLAMLAAIRRASSRVSSLAADRWPGSSS